METYKDDTLASTTSSNVNWTWELGGSWPLNSNDTDSITDLMNNGTNLSSEEEEDDTVATVSLTCIVLILSRKSTRKGEFRIIPRTNSKSTSENAVKVYIVWQQVTVDWESNSVRNVLSVQAFYGIFLSLMIITSIVGNALVCIAVATERSLRRIGNLFIVSLAIADMFVACLVMTFAGVNDLLGYWIFGEQFCDTWIAFDVMCSTASILNLAAISLDRYVHIKDPLRYGRWVNKRSILGVIAVVWILAALISFVPISLDLHRADNPEQPPDINEPELPTCALDLSPTYAVVSSCVSFYLPCVLMVGIYCRLYLYARKHVKNIKAVTRPPPRCGESRPSAPHPSSSYQVSDHKAAVTVGVIMGVFLVCWVPFFCANIIAAYCKTCISITSFKILTWLGYSNSAFNPIIYSIFNSEFRAAFHRILTSRLPPCCQKLSCCSCSCQIISCCRRCGYQAVALIQRRRSDPEVSSLHQMNGICTFRDTPRSSGGSIPGTFTRSTTPREIRCGSGSGNFGEKVSAI